MKVRKIVFVLALSLLAAGCSSSSGKFSSDDDTNVALAGEGRELKDIQFDYDSYSVDASAKSILQANSNWLQANSSRKIQVEGHCDERGTNEYNMVLGANRARAAMDYLRSLGVAASRMSTVSYGEELPLDPSHNDAAWAKNRRAHFNVQ